MPVKKPLVLTNGEIEQLQSGDQVAQATIFNQNNANVNTVVICTPVYATTTADEMDLAQADAVATKDVLGFVAETSVAAAASGAVQSDGVLSATTAQWDAVTGDSGGLTAGSKYYLDESTAGMLTTTPPSGSGEFVAMVGMGLSTTEMEISIRSTIKL